jgi:predicted AlkP superfamily phosphohydrolase/phosphomutase
MSRVVIFGVDGATYTVLDDLARQGVMPYLAQFMASGSRAPLASTVPPLTPIAWTNLVTGRSPGHHGITGFFQHAGGEAGSVRVNNARQLCVETIWAMASRQGLRAGTLNFPLHNPPPRINGYVIPGWVTWRWLKRASHPPQLCDQLKKDIPGFDLKELAMRYDEERKAIAGADMEHYDDWIQLHIRRERQWFNVLRHQMINDPCDLTGIVFDGVDKLQHLLWQFLDPALTPAEPSKEFLRVRELCRDYFRQIDHFLEETVKLAGPDATILMASDHGFTSTDEVLYINTWLEKEGFLTWKPETPIASEDSQLLGEGVPYHLVAFDMTKTKAFAATASSNGIFIRGNGTNGSSGEDYETLRRRLVDALQNRCLDPETGNKLVSRVWLREEVFAGPNMHHAPDITLTLHDHGFFSVFRSDRILKRRPKTFGTHHPDGIFIIKGPGVRRGERLERVKLVDLAPTILYQLELPVGMDLEGRVIEEAFTPQYLATRSVQFAVGSGGANFEPQLGETEDDDPQILDRLKALGYIE